MARKAKLSMQHRVAIDRYFVNGFKQNDALRHAGYAESTVRDHPEYVFQHPEVVKEIARRRKQIAKKFDVTQDWIVGRLVRMVTAGDRLAKFKVVQEDGTIAWDFRGATKEELSLLTELHADIYIEGRGEDAQLVKKFRIKYPDEHAALIALGRHLGMFTDKVEVTGDLASRIQAGRKRAAHIETEDEEQEQPVETIH